MCLTFCDSLGGNKFYGTIPTNLFSTGINFDVTGNNGNFQAILGSPTAVGWAGVLTDYCDAGEVVLPETTICGDCPFGVLLPCALASSQPSQA